MPKKISEEIIQQIINKNKNGFTCKQLSEEYKISLATIYKIIRSLKNNESTNSEQTSCEETEKSESTNSIITNETGKKSHKLVLAKR